MDTVTIYTDGSCSPNPGPGGWAAVLECRGIRREISGAEHHATNNIMELRAAIEGLKALKRRCRVTLISDSSYVADNARVNLPVWKARVWKLIRGGKVKNVELWQELDRLLGDHEVTFERVNGHSGIAENERADILANTARRAREPEAVVA